MRNSKTCQSLFLILAALTCLPTYAFAHNEKHEGEHGSGNSEKRQCIAETRDSFLECKRTCWENMKLGKSACGINPECHQACTDAFKTCKDSAEAGLTTCLVACDAPLDQAKADCKTSAACGTGGKACFRSPDYRGCLRDALLARFTCTQDCRDAHKTDPSEQAALKACFDAAKDCHKACNVSATPTPAVTAVAAP